MVDPHVRRLRCRDDEVDPRRRAAEQRRERVGQVRGLVIERLAEHGHVVDEQAQPRRRLVVLAPPRAGSRRCRRWPSRRVARRGSVADARALGRGARGLRRRSPPRSAATVRGRRGCRRPRRPRRGAARAGRSGWRDRTPAGAAPSSCRPRARRRRSRSPVAERSATSATCRCSWGTSVTPHTPTRRPGGGSNAGMCAGSSVAGSGGVHRGAGRGVPARAASSAIILATTPISVVRRPVGIGRGAAAAEAGRSSANGEISTGLRCPSSTSRAIRAAWKPAITSLAPLRR